MRATITPQLPVELRRDCGAFVISSAQEVFQRSRLAWMIVQPSATDSVMKPSDLLKPPCLGASFVCNAEVIGAYACDGAT